MNGTTVVHKSALLRASKAI